MTRKTAIPMVGGLMVIMLWGGFQTAEAADYLGRKDRTKKKKKSLTLADRKAGMKNKLFGGVKNIISAPFEIPAAIVKQGRRQGYTRGAFSGTVEGMTNFARRATSGVSDVVTFPTQFPRGNYGTSMAPKGPIRVFRDANKPRFAYRRR